MTGTTAQSQDGTTTDTDEMWSAGAGVRISINENFTLRADYGAQLLDSGSEDSGRFHIGVILSY